MTDEFGCPDSYDAALHCNYIRDYTRFHLLKLTVIQLCFLEILYVPQFALFNFDFHSNVIPVCSLHDLRSSLQYTQIS